MWAPSEGWECVGASGIDISAIFKLTVYKLRDDEPARRVHDLFCLLPGSGKPGLDPAGAEAISHIIFRVNVPSILGLTRNSMSVVELSTDDRKADLSNHDEVSKLLDGKRTDSSNSNAEFSLDKFKAVVYIGGGDAPGTSITIKSK